MLAEGTACPGRAARGTRTRRARRQPGTGARVGNTLSRSQGRRPHPRARGAHAPFHACQRLLGADLPGAPPSPAGACAATHGGRRSRGDAARGDGRGACEASQLPPRLFPPRGVCPGLCTTEQGPGQCDGRPRGQLRGRAAGPLCTAELASWAAAGMEAGIGGGGGTGGGHSDPGRAVAVALAREVAGAASGRLTGPADGLPRGPEERRRFKGLPAGAESRARGPPSPPRPSLPTSLPEHKAKDRCHRHRAEQHRCGRQTPCERGVSRVPRCGAGGTRLQTHCHKRGGGRGALVKTEARALHRNIKKWSRTCQNHVFQNPRKQSRVRSDHADTGD